MIAQTLLHERAVRARLFGRLAEPAWMMLLDLWAADARQLCVSDLCIGCFAPPTTGLRHLGLLVARGFVERLDDPHDERRIWVRLTDEARTLLLRFADETQERRLAA